MLRLGGRALRAEEVGMPGLTVDDLNGFRVDYLGLGFRI